VPDAFFTMRNVRSSAFAMVSEADTAPYVGVVEGSETC
jgi:hypothetical protein